MIEDAERELDRLARADESLGASQPTDGWQQKHCPLERGRSRGGQAQGSGNSSLNHRAGLQTVVDAAGILADWHQGIAIVAKIHQNRQCRRRQGLEA